MHAIPFFLLGLVLSWLFAFRFQWFPIFGGYSAGANPAWDWTFILDVLRHAVLPALSIVLVSVGGWALAMRGMMVTTMGEDYVTFAEAKGLRSATIFTRYCMRNAILPQTTGLALALGQILSGAVLVEAIFGYPGIGALLFQAIEENDFFPDSRDCVHSHRGARLCDVRAGRGLSLARPPHLLSPELGRVLGYLRRNVSLVVGLVLLGILAVFIIVGALTVDTGNAQPLSVPALQPPSWDYPFGTDRNGRDLLAVMVAGTPLTLRIGFIAGFIGVGIGAILAFTAAYYRGRVDTVIRSIADIGLTVPAVACADHYRRVAKGQSHGKPDGDHYRFPGLA